jgi:phosphoribosylaminoimidazolecarboxamide formyltransferase/IMP cyclohydrolase
MRALLSVYDKTDVVELAQGLVALGFEVVSTGGTLAALESAGVPVTAVSDVTGFPEILDGRVKTLHPRILGGLLARRDEPAHMAALRAHDITPISVVAANLYPFAATIARGDVALLEALEQIDIGGPVMIRAAAKNFPDVVVLTDPADYQSALADLAAGGPPIERRRALAARAFAHTAAYDAVVAEYLRDDAIWPEEIAVAGRLVNPLRYGENPRQRGAAYRRLRAGAPAAGVLDAAQLAGKELSFNNLLDADAAWSAVQGFARPAVAIVKHTIPCGLAERETLAEAFEAALAGDPVSAYGGIVALNRAIDAATAERMAKVFFEVVIAPGFTDEAVELLGKRKALRLLRMPEAATTAPATDWDLRPIAGGLLVQEPDSAADDPATWRVVTDRAPDAGEWDDLVFAWHAVRHVKSNAIVLARDHALVGVGSGQPNRVESVRIAVARAGGRASGAVLASDAFFPFADGLEAAMAAGVTAVVQPGGSVRDDEVIAAANRGGVAMLFTGTRHFRH